MFEREGFRCEVPTLRFHDVDPAGEPDPRLGTTSLLDYAQDLERLIRALGEKPILLGHSMGGLLSQMLAARGLARAAVLFAPAPPAGIFALRPSVIRSFLSGLTRWRFWAKPFRQTFGEAAYSMLGLLSPEDRRSVYDRFVYESGRAASEIGFWPFDPNGAARVDESRVRCPLLIVAGRRDKITPVAVTRRVARKYAHVAKYDELNDHAHWMVGEPGWEGVAQHVLNWLRGIF